MWSSTCASYHDRHCFHNQRHLKCHHNHQVHPICYPHLWEWYWPKNWQTKRCWQYKRFCLSFSSSGSAMITKAWGHILLHWLLSFDEKSDFLLVSSETDLGSHPRPCPHRQYFRLSIWFHAQEKRIKFVISSLWFLPDLSEGRPPPKASSPPLPQRRPFVSPAGNLMRNGTHECGFFHIWLRSVTSCISHLHQSYPHFLSGALCVSSQSHSTQLHTYPKAKTPSRFSMGGKNTWTHDMVKWRCVNITQ